MSYKSAIPNIAVKSVKETVAFYTDILGFKPILQDLKNGIPVWAMVGSESVFFMFQDELYLAKEFPNKKIQESSHKVNIHFKVSDIDSLYSRIKDSVRVLKNIHTTPFGTQEFSILDNNDIVLIFSEEEPIF